MSLSQQAASSDRVQQLMLEQRNLHERQQQLLSEVSSATWCPKNKLRQTFFLIPHLLESWQLKHLIDLKKLAVP